MDAANFEDEARGLEPIWSHDPTIGHATAVVILISVSDKNAIDVMPLDLVVAVVALDQCEAVVDEDAVIDQLPTDGSFFSYLPIVILLCYVVELKIEQSFSEIKV